MYAKCIQYFQIMSLIKWVKQKVHLGNHQFLLKGNKFNNKQIGTI